MFEHRGGFRMVDHLPDGQAKPIRGKVVIGDDASISTLCTILPNVTIGEGAVVGANSLVGGDLEPWGIYVGSPAKKVGERQRPAF
jgi:galactoside O-acetyltransferase